MEKQELTVMEMGVIRYVLSSDLAIIPPLKKHEKIALITARKKLTNNQALLQRETGIAYDLGLGELKIY